MKFQIKVRANSSRQEIQTDMDGKISKIFLKKPARENKANKELESLLSKYFTKKFSVLQSYVENNKQQRARAKIIKGHTSKTKTIEVEYCN